MQTQKIDGAAPGRRTCGPKNAVAISAEDPSDTLEQLQSLPPIPFPLLYDPDNATARAYGLASPHGGVEERTFYIDQTQTIRHAYKPDQPGGEIPLLLALKRTPSKWLANRSKLADRHVRHRQ